MINDCAILVTPVTLPLIAEARPEADLTMHMQTTYVCVLMDVDGPHERLVMLPEGAFRVMYQEDPTTLDSWNFVTPRTSH